MFMRLTFFLHRYFISFDIYYPSQCHGKVQQHRAASHSYLYSKYKLVRHIHSVSVLIDKPTGTIIDCGKEGLRGRVYQRVD